MVRLPSCPPTGRSQFKMEDLRILSFFAPLLPSLSFSEKAMPELERLEVQYSMLEGLSGAEKLAKLKEVHLTCDDKAGEDMTKEIVKEMRESAVKRIDGKKPRIIHHEKI